MSNKTSVDSSVDTQNTGTVAQTSEPPEQPTVIPNFSLPSAQELPPSEVALEAGTNTFATPAGYSPAAVARSAGLPLPSVVYSEAPTGTVIGPSRVSEVGTSFGSSAATADGVTRKRYTVLKEHAKGGMGQVSVALDEELDREVALKEIQPRYAYDRGVAARFLLEARVTGKLEHPGIVPVYGLNRHPDGRPYYAMRFITGESLQDAVKAFHLADGPDRDPHERALALRQLLTRFVDVCNTIAYSHSRGILHRDLKPANVMLGGFGETLVVDWGLAKDTTAVPKKPALDSTQVIPALAFERPAAPPPPAAGEADAAQDDGTTKTRIQERPAMSLAGPAAGDTGELTEVGKAMGTPAFMAPEQADGRWDDVGMLADIYSLGATLYAILTGKAPFRGDTQDILDRVRRGEMIPIFEAKPTVPPALAAVCHKAMALRPQDRYPTALDLAGDVERWMADEPVSVYREPWTARLLRWARRHRNLVFGSAAVLLTALATITVGYFQVHAEQKRTFEAKQLVEGANKDLKDEQRKVLAARAVAEASREDARDALLTLTDDAIGEILTAQHAVTGKQRQFLESVIKLYERFIKEAPDAHESQLFVAGAHFRVGRLYFKLAQNDHARASYQKVFELATGHAEPEWAQLVAETRLYAGIQYLALGQYPQAEAELTKAHETFFATVTANSADGKTARPESWHRLGQAQDRLGLLFYSQRRFQEAEDWFRMSLANRRRLVEIAPKEPEYRFRIAQSLRQIAMVSNTNGNRLEALEAATEARQICTALLATDPTSAVYLYYRAEVDGLLSIATADDGTGDGKPTRPFAKFARGMARPAVPKAAHRTESTWYAENAVADWSQLVRLYPADVGYRHQLATANLNLSIAHSRAGRYKAAADAMKATTTVLADLDDLLPDNPRTAMLRGRSYHAEAVQQRDQGEPAKAQAAAEKAVAVAGGLVEKYPTNAGYLNDLGCYQIELAALGLAAPTPDGKRSEELLNAAWNNTVAALSKLGASASDPDFWANVRSFGRVYVDLLVDLKRPDVVEKIAAQITDLKVIPDNERYEAAALYGRAAMLLATDETRLDPQGTTWAKRFATLAVTKLSQLEFGFEHLRAVQTDPDLEAVRTLPELAELIREFREPLPRPREKN